MNFLKFLTFTLVLLAFSCSDQYESQSSMNDDKFQETMQDTFTPISRIYEYPLGKHYLTPHNDVFNAADACNLVVYISPDCDEEWKEAARSAIDELNQLDNVGINISLTFNEEEADVSIECFDERNCVSGLTGILPAGLTYEETLTIYRDGKDDYTGPREDRVTVMIEGKRDCFCHFMSGGGILTPGLSDCEREWIMGHEIMHALGFGHFSPNPNHPNYIQGTATEDPFSITQSGPWINIVEENGFCNCDEQPMLSEGDIEALEIVYPLDAASSCECPKNENYDFCECEGKPIVSIISVDGQPGGTSFNYICSSASNHNFIISVENGDCALEWDDNNSTTSFSNNCTSFDWTPKFVNGKMKCAVIKVTAENECGTGSSTFTFCPNPSSC